MIVYVDDFKLSGAPATMREAWDRITKVTIIEDDGEEVPAIKIGKWRRWTASLVVHTIFKISTLKKAEKERNDLGDAQIHVILH